MTKRNKAFQKALELWEVSHLLPLHARLGHVKELSYYDLFSVTQLAKISRTDTKTIRKHMNVAPIPGGRFHPEALSTLQILEEQVSLEAEVSRPLIRLCVQSGCSGTTIGRLIGLSYGKIYRMMEEA